jgi:hypothetical protein
MDKRAKMAAGAGLLVFVIWSVYISYSAARFVRPRDERVVQIIKSPKEKHEAQLIRRYAFLDLNFVIELDGKRIYTSPDFRPNYTIPFRETLLWDESGHYLVFEVNWQRLWGYNVFNRKPLTPAELRTVKIPKVKPEDLGYSGTWPDKAAD